LHLIFDLDGTLVDSQPGILYSLKTAVRQTFPEIDPEMFDFKIGPPVREMLRIGLKTVSEAELDRLETAFRVSYDGGGWQLTTVYPSVVETLVELTRCGVSCYVVTNKPSLATARILTLLGLTPYFDTVLCPDSRQPRFSSKAEMLEELLEERIIPANQAIYVGDSVDDFCAAEQCGIKFISIEYGYGRIPQKEKRLRRVNSFDELLSVP
jgi:phosphoglycolate phosphatase